MKLPLTVCLMLVLPLVSGAAKPELQRAEVFYSNSGFNQRVLFEESAPEYDERSIGAFDKDELKLKWAIVSGDRGNWNDRVRVRLRCNGQSIDLYARKNSSGNFFDRNVIYLNEAGPKPPKEGEPADLSGPDLSLEEKQQERDLPDLRIVDWSHERLWIKFSAVDSKPSSRDMYFRFDLTESLSD